MRQLASSRSDMLARAIHTARGHAAARRAVRQTRRLLRPAWFGTLHRTSPLSQAYGADRGKPVNRQYIERFLERHCGDIHGRVLEVQSDDYTDHFGHDVDQRDIVDIDPTNTRATIIADLGAPDAIPSGSFDCFICTQTLTLIYDTRAFISHAYRILRPGGVLLLTVSSAARTEPAFLGGDYWRFTPSSCQRLFAETFGPEQVNVQAYGNVLAMCASLMGLACEDLSRHDLDVNDPCFPLIVAVRAVKR